MEIPQYLDNYYTINTENGKAKAVCCPYKYRNGVTLRAKCCIKSGNFYLTLEEAKADAEKINEIFRKRVK